MASSKIVGGDIDLDALTAQLCSAVDDMAGDTRKKFLTCVPAQDSTYQSKLADCQAYLKSLTGGALSNDSAQEKKSHPWVAAEADAQDMSMKLAAQNVVDTFDQWQAIGIKIEAARIRGKRLIKAATTASAKAAQRSTTFATFAEISKQANASYTT